jgi:hypothetical protein
MGNTFEPEKDQAQSHSRVHGQQKDNSKGFAHQECITPEDARKVEKLYTAFAVEGGTVNIVQVTQLCKSQTLAQIMCQSGVLKTSKSFLEFVVKCTRMNSGTTLRTLWKRCECEGLAGPKVTLLFQILVEVYQFDDSAAEPFLAKILASITKQAGVASAQELTLEQFSIWAENFAPRFAVALETIMKEFCFGASTSGTPQERFVCPSFASHNSEIIPDIDLLTLGLFSSNLQGEWTRLYTTSADGLSFNSIVHQILGYDGSTCMLIRAVDKRVFGIFSYEAWKEHNKFYGSSLNIMFSLYPTIQILRSKPGSNGSYQWLNLSSYGMPHGLGFGGTRERYRLFIPDSLENCTLNSNCLTYEPGEFTAPPAPQEQAGGKGAAGVGKSKIDMFENANTNNFEIDCLEVWACGGTAAIMRGQAAQVQSRALKDEAIQRARKVDKAQFFNNSFDQEFLLSGTFKHRQEVQDR